MQVLHLKIKHFLLQKLPLLGNIPAAASHEHHQLQYFYMNGRELEISHDQSRPFCTLLTQGQHHRSVAVTMCKISSVKM